MASKKTLSQLSLQELRHELRGRELKVSGNKEALMERLRQNMIEEEQDPETYVFEIEPTMMELSNMIQEQGKTNTDIGNSLKEDMKSGKDELGSIKSFVTELKNDIDSFKQQLRNEVAELRSQMVGDVDSKIQQLRNEMKAELQKTEMTGKIKPPVFDGFVSWSAYRLQFEAAAQINRWVTKAEKATGLMLALRGKAAELLQTMTDRTDYDVMVKTMELRYGNEHLQEVFRMQLKNRQQKNGETLQELAADVERLARLAYPSETQELLDVLVTDAFIDGVRDSELKKAIRISGKRKINEALIYALFYEAAEVSARNIHYCRTLNVLEEEDLPRLIRRMVEKALNEREHYQTLRRSRKTLRWEHYQTSRRSRKTLRCWNCNTPGHLRRSCNMLFQGQGCASERQPLRFYGFRKQGLATQKIETPRIKTPFRVLEQSRTLRVQGKIGAGSYRFLLDTGATRSIVGPSLVLDQEIIRVNCYTLKTTGGELLPILGQIRLNFEIGSQPFSHDFLIANVVDDCILGLDFMQEFGLSLNIGSETVQYGHIEFPLLDDGVEGIQVKRIEHTTIPKWSDLSVNRYHKRDKLKWNKLEGQLHPRRANNETSINHCCGCTGSYKESVGGGSAVDDHNDKSDASSFQDKESGNLFNDNRRPEKKTLDEETRGVTYKQSETIAFDVFDMSALMGMTKADNVGSVSNTPVRLPVLTTDRNLKRTVRAAPRMNNANTINRSGLDKSVYVCLHKAE